MNNLPINRDSHPRTGDLLVPKRGRHLDPVLVIHRQPGDSIAVVKDQALVEADPAWEANRRSSLSQEDGALWLTYRELGRNYVIDGEYRASLERHLAKRFKEHGLVWRGELA